MRNSYPEVEQVFKIDSGEYMGRYIFPAYAAGGKIYQNVETVVVGAINGNRDPLVKAFSGSDRDSDYVLLNINRVDGFNKEVLDVPTDILAKVKEYNSEFPKYRSIQMNDSEELDEALYKKVSELSRELNNYFQK